MQKMALNKLILATGSVFGHLAIIAWIFSGHAGGSTKPNNAHQFVANVFIISPAPTVIPQPSTKVPTDVIAASAEKKGIAKPLPIILSQPRAVETAPSYYFSVKELDRGPLPKSEPDLQQIENKSVTNLPIRLRLFIDRFGKVEKIVTLESDMVDQDFVGAVTLIFLGTIFIPGRFDGIDVPSYFDIEISSASTLPSSKMSSFHCLECASIE